MLVIQTVTTKFKNQLNLPTQNTRVRATPFHVVPAVYHLNSDHDHLFVFQAPNGKFVTADGDGLWLVASATSPLDGLVLDLAHDDEAVASEAADANPLGHQLFTILNMYDEGNDPQKNFVAVTANSGHVRALYNECNAAPLELNPASQRNEYVLSAQRERTPPRGRQAR